ncbi:DUF3772 domain-containing protein [Comamonas sp. GB3 AK4-5]|uniref:DUF3772 domain-containing protein n=1 Tax=Comamonas sp. GB3 AK4-5 TaxID=3231487 RepID=UPI00351E1AF7
MQSFCTHLLRWLVALHLCMGLAHAADPLILPDSGMDPQAQLQSVASTLEKVHASLDDAEATDTLQTLVEQSIKAKRDADAAVTQLEPLLKQLDARMAQLGPAADGAAEGSDIREQRKLLGQQQTDLGSSIKRGKLLSVEAQQTASSIEQMRAQQFNAQIASKAISPLSPALWRQFAEQLPADMQRQAALMRQGQASLISAIEQHGWSKPLRGLLIALVLMFPLRMWLRHLGRQFAMSKRAPDGRLRRTGLAVWQLVVGTVLPGLASLVFIEHLRDIEAIAPRLQSVADTWIKSSFVAAFFLSISASLLVPKRPSWRLLAIDDIAAPALTRYAWGAALLTWFSMMLNAVDIAARTSTVSTVALDGLVALTYVGLILGVQLTINQQRKRQAAPHSTESGHHEPQTRSGWLLLAWLGGHITVLAALVAALLGYLNFSVFVATQMVWITVVVLATSLLMKFADDCCTWMFESASRMNQAISQGTGLRPARLEQLGVLLSALLRVCLLLLGVAALTAPFGNANYLMGWGSALAQGVSVGGSTLTPMTLLRAALVLVLGLTFFRALQHWLVDTYLPKTELDIGARNSISTVTRYVGIILSGLWTLAALGIGFERVALLASALSVGIGFGLQAITQNFVSGLILLAERPVKLGDRVRIGDQVGDIRRISVRATEIQMDDRSTLIVPNSELITKSVQNLTMDNPVGRVTIAFSVPLNTDIVRLKELLLGIYTAHVAVLETPAPNMYVDSINGSVVNIVCHGYVGSPRNAYSTRSDLLFALLRDAAQAGIPLVSATDIHLVQSPPSQAAAAPAAPPAANPATPST